MCTQIKLEIKAGQIHKVYHTDWYEGLSVMDLLRKFATVETYVSKKGLEFVVSVDGVAFEPKKSYWGYFINGLKAQNTASLQLVETNDTILWELRYFPNRG